MNGWTYRNVLCHTAHRCRRGTSPLRRPSCRRWTPCAYADAQQITPDKLIVLGQVAKKCASPSPSSSFPFFPLVVASRQRSRSRAFRRALHQDHGRAARGPVWRAEGGPAVDLEGAHRRGVRERACVRCVPPSLPHPWTWSSQRKRSGKLGKALRTVKSCVGTTWCRYGIGDSVASASLPSLPFRLGSKR